MPSKSETKQTLPDTQKQRRRRLLAETQGRRLDEAYLSHPNIRDDVDAEAAASDPDSLVTPDMLAHLQELIEEKRLVVNHEALPEASPGSGSVQEGAAAGHAILNALTGEASEGASGLAGQPGGRPGWEIYPQRAFVSTDAVVIVPGFLASALGDTAAGGFGLIWADPLLPIRDELGALQLGPYDGQERDLDPRARIAALSALPYFYDVLRLALEVRQYSVEVFAVDWRKNLELAAGMLAARLRVLAGQSWRPIHLVAHSQGALVARRALQLLGRDEARRIVRHLVLLGPANFGSFSAAFALAGNYSLLDMIRKLAIEPRRGLQQVLASMTGVYQLLPFDPDRTPWLRESDYTRPGFWKTPVDAPRLAQFYGWARSIDTSFMNDRTAVILGDNHGAPTTGGVVFKRSVLQDSPSHALAGDGTVPHSCSVLPGTRTYLAPGTEHSMLATYRKVIDAVRDVLADRPVGLGEVSSLPADYLSTTSGPARGMATPDARV